MPIIARPAGAVRPLAHGGDLVLPLDQGRAVGALPAELRRVADAAGGIDWEVHLVDGTSVRAYRCAAGDKEAHSQALGGSRLPPGVGANTTLDQ